MSASNPFQIHPASSGPKLKDPVCGMEVTPEKSAGSFAYQGQTFYFCSTGCLAKFQADPEKYLNPKPPMAAAGAENVEYTCPMHPEVVRIGPGTCPICGMALEPKHIQLEEAENPELADMQRRFWISAALSAPLLVLAMAMLGPHHYRIWIELALATPVVLWGGWPFFVRAWQSLVTRNLNMFTLIGMGVGAAYIFSIFALVFLPDTDVNDDVYFEPKAWRPDGPRLWLGGESVHPRLLRRIVRYAHGFHPLGQPSDDDLVLLRNGLAAAGRDLDELELVGGMRAVFPDDSSPSALEPALASLPGQLERGFTTFCIKPSQFVDDLARYPAWCREVVERVGELGR